MAYDIFFRGEALEGQNLGQVKQHFAKLFKADDEKLAQLFSGKVVALKKQLSKEDAVKYQQLFKKAGAKIYIKQGEVATTAATPKPLQPSAAPAAATQTPDAALAPENTKPAITNSTLQALPVGSDILNDSERQQDKPQSIQVDVSSLSLAAQSPLPVVEKPTFAAPDTSHLSASTSAEPLQSSRFEAREVDTSAYTLADVGSNVLDFYDDIPAPLPKLDHLSLADTGSTLSEPKKPTAKAPDTSHISIAPNN